MYAATVHGLWPRELNVYQDTRPSHPIKTRKCVMNHNMHTQSKDGKVQFAVTLTPATAKAEKKNKDTSGGATERVRKDISLPKATGKGAEGGRVYDRWNVVWHSNS